MQKESKLHVAAEWIRFQEGKENLRIMRKKPRDEVDGRVGVVCSELAIEILPKPEDWLSNSPRIVVSRDGGNTLTHRSLAQETLATTLDGV